MPITTEPLNPLSGWIVIPNPSNLKELVLCTLLKLTLDSAVLDNFCPVSKFLSLGDLEKPTIYCRFLNEANYLNSFRSALSYMHRMK